MLKVKVEKRANIGHSTRSLFMVGSIVAALLVVAIILLISGSNPLTVYGAMIRASLGSRQALASTLVTTTPLIFTGLCAVVAFRVKVYNIGGEGQLYIGAVAASGVSLAVGSLNPALSIVLMVICGAIGGVAWAVIPALLKSAFNANEILTTLMLNFVADFLILYLIFDSESFWRDTTSTSGIAFPSGKSIAQRDWWPSLHIGGLAIPFGIFLAVAFAVFVVFWMTRTRIGLKMESLGDNSRGARYAGVKNTRVALLVFLASGALAGIGGAAVVGSSAHALDPQGLIQAQYGYTGIIVAALVAFDPAFTAIGGFILGCIMSAGAGLTGISFPDGLVGIIEGLLLILVVAGNLAARYRVVFGKPRGTEERRRGSSTVHESVSYRSNEAV